MQNFPTNTWHKYLQQGGRDRHKHKQTRDLWAVILRPSVIYFFPGSHSHCIPIDMNFSRQGNQHTYSEEDPIIDNQGHEIVHPEPIDREDELDTDFVAEADDSGDDDYVDCVPGDDDGYDDDRLQYFNDDSDERDSDDYSPERENMEIRNQEVTGDALYEGYEDPAQTGDDYDFYYRNNGKPHGAIGNDDDEESLP